MKKYLIAALMAGCIWTVAGGGVAGEPEPPLLDPAVVEQESQWERFKSGAREAGGAIATGTKKTAKKAGHAIAEGYEESKDYIKEKLDD